MSEYGSGIRMGAELGELGLEPLADLTHTTLLADLTHTAL